jgi:hypothetical protein
LPPLSGPYGHAIGPAIDLGVRIQTVFTAGAGVRQSQQLVRKSQSRLSIDRESYADGAKSVDRHHERMSDSRAVTEVGNRNALFALDVNSRSEKHEPDDVGREQRAATHE